MKSFPQPLSKKEEQIYLERLKEGDPEAKDVLILRNMRLVAHVVKKYQTSEYETEDMISVGMIGLMKAAGTYDMEKGSRFATYAARCIENEILMLLRTGKKYSRDVSLYEPIGVDKDGESVSLMDVLEAPGQDTAEGLILQEDIGRLRKEYQRRLNDTEKTVLRMRYGLFGENMHTQKEIAGKLGISRSYISRIEKKAIDKLRTGFSLN